MEKKINLKQILLTNIPKNCYWEDMGNLTNCPEEYVLLAMKEACKQVLELAVENTQVDVEMCMGHRTGFTSVDEQSILNILDLID